MVLCLVIMIVLVVALRQIGNIYPTINSGTKQVDLIYVNHLIYNQRRNFYVPDATGVYLDANAAKAYRTEVLQGSAVESLFLYAVNGNSLAEIPRHIIFEAVHIESTFAIVRVASKPDGKSVEFSQGLDLPLFELWFLTANGWKHRATCFTVAQGKALANRK